MEEFAGKWENFDEFYGHLPRWELECQRQNFAKTYRRLVGVMPDQRDILRRQLEESLRTGNVAVDAVIESVRNDMTDQLVKGNHLSSGSNVEF